MTALRSADRAVQAKIYTKLRPVFDVTAFNPSPAPDLLTTSNSRSFTVDREMGDGGEPDLQAER